MNYYHACIQYPVLMLHFNFKSNGDDDYRITLESCYLS